MIQHKPDMALWRVISSLVCLRSSCTARTQPLKLACSHTVLPRQDGVAQVFIASVFANVQTR